MGNYHRPLDEFLNDPPYRLAPYQSHGFFVPADHRALVKLTNDTLNKPLGPNAPVRFEVPPGTSSLLVSFNHYGKSESISKPDQGSVAYTEVYFAYLVYPVSRGRRVRSFEPMFHVPLLYIDGVSGGTGYEPASLATHLGREVFGLNKLPGAIEYAPSKGQARLRVFDRPANPRGGPLQLRTALEVAPKSRGRKPRREDDPILAPYGARASVIQEFLARALGTEPDKIGRPFLGPDGRGLLPGRRYTVTVDGLPLSFIWGLQPFASLVGLKQLRQASWTRRAAYQSVVRGRVWNRGGQLDLPTRRFSVKFHALRRLDLATRLLRGVSQHDLGWARVFHWNAELEYGYPRDSKEWVAP